MEKIMRSTQVSTEEDEIFITQPDIGFGEQNITINVDQVEILIMWLKEAQEEINNG